MILVGIVSITASQNPYGSIDDQGAGAIPPLHDAFFELRFPVVKLFALASKRPSHRLTRIEPLLYRRRCTVIPEDPINYLKQPELNLRSFLTAYTAFLANYRGALWLRDFAGNNDSLATALDEARPELGIPGRMYSRLQLGLTMPETLVLLTAGRAHLEFAKASGQLTAPEDQELFAYLERASAEIIRRLGHQPALFAENPLKLFEQTTFTLWFPVQKEVSEQMGDIRTTRRANLITGEQAHSVRPQLEPGDIMLERRNWYLSNVGLPGFWPHTALYTGDLDELDRYFAGEPALGDLACSAYLQQKFPAVYRQYQERHAGNAPSVLEAVSEGVILHQFELSAAADYLAMLRPRLSKADKLQAILFAYTFLGRPYDFNFDFVTDNELVCSEVIAKAYSPTAPRKGLHFELGRTAGRLVLGPNDIIRKFDREFGTPHQELDFVLFLDGSEADRKTVNRDAAALRASWQRPKWDLAQE